MMINMAKYSEHITMTSLSRKRKVNESYDDNCRIEWTNHFLALIEYSKVHGNCNISEKSHFECIIDNGMASKSYQGNLGKWLKEQRASYANGVLQPAKLALLIELVNAGKLVLEFQNEDSWNRHYAALLLYGKENGDYNVPAKLKYECQITLENGNIEHYEENLGSWLDRQRRCKKCNAPSLTQEREALLQTLVDQGMLNWTNYGGDRGTSKEFKEWLKHYAALKEYGKLYGNCNIAQRKHFDCVLPIDYLDNYFPQVTSLQFLGKSTKSPTANISSYISTLNDWEGLETMRISDWGDFEFEDAQTGDYILSCLSDLDEENTLSSSQYIINDLSSTENSSFTCTESVDSVASMCSDNCSALANLDLDLDILLSKDNDDWSFPGKENMFDPNINYCLPPGAENLFSPETENFLSMTEDPIVSKSVSEVCKSYTCENSYSTRNDDCYSPRTDCSYSPRADNCYSTRNDDCYSPRTDCSYSPRAGNCYSTRNDDCYSPRTDCSYSPRAGNCYSTRNDDCYSPRTDCSYSPRADNCYSTRNDDCYSPRTDYIYSPRAGNCYSTRNDDCYSPRTDCRYSPRAGNCYSTRNDDCYSPRTDYIYSPRADIDSSDRQYNRPLGKWLDHQRLKKKKGLLPLERERLLQHLVDQGLLVWEVAKK